MTRAEQAGFDTLDTPEHLAWKRHRELLLNIPSGTVDCRLCIGLGLAVDTTTEASWINRLDGVHLPNKSVRWLKMMDLPTGSFDLGTRHREVHLAAAIAAKVSFGMPHISFDAHQGDEAWDFRAIPHHKMPAQLFRAFNAVELAMSTTALYFRSGWDAHREKFHEALGLAPRPALKSFLFGQEVFETIQPPLAWMPRAYLGFPAESAPGLFERATKKSLGGALFIPEEMQRAFLLGMAGGAPYTALSAGRVAALARETYDGLAVNRLELEYEDGTAATVRFSRDASLLRAKGSHFAPGDVLAEENWHQRRDDAFWQAQPLWKRWDVQLPKLFGRHVLAHLRIWTERQHRQLMPGLVHVSTSLCALAAAGNAVDDALMWDVAPGMPYYSEDCDTFIFPTLRLSRWDDFRGTLPGDIDFDFTPVDPRFKPRSDKKKRNRKPRRRPTK